ncbi:MAG: L,D-transpeptidase, partial [Chloroflexota bacterium]
MLGRLPAQFGGVMLGRDMSPAVRVLTRMMLTVVGLTALIAGWYAAQIAVLDWMQPRSLTSNLENINEPLRPGAQLELSLRGYGAEIDDVQLLRSDVAAGAGRDETIVQTRLIEAGPDTWLVSMRDGSAVLQPDSAYRLVVQASSPRPGLPVPTVERVTEQYRFGTLPTPRPNVPKTVQQPRWAVAVPILWSLPLESVEVQVNPPVPVESWIDPQTADRTWVKLSGEAISGQTYQVTFAHALGKDGMALQQPASFDIMVPERPRIVDPPTSAVTLKVGQTFDLMSSVPLTDIKVESSGELQARATLDGQRIQLGLAKYRQGAEAQVTLTSATSILGAPLAETFSVILRSPPALDAPRFVPENGARSVPLRSRPYLEFDAPPVDPEAVRRAITMRPAIPGQWNWLDEVNLVFTPAERLPTQTTINVTLRGGPDGPRSAAGGYLEKDLVTSFTTAPNRRIEVSLGKQQLYMLENERIIRTVTVGTGVRGAETPLGEYEVLYKMPKTRMQGVNPSGVRYDIADVPWVLPFLGDYAIHGVHWRSSFGSPASNGCVGMTVEEARVLYDWADVGTTIRIYQ